MDPRLSIDSSTRRAIPGRLKASSHLVLLLALLPATNAGAANWRTEANISVTETWTDNSNRNAESRSDWVTQVTPGVRISGQGARVSGSLDARLDNTLHASGQSDNRTSLGLFANGNVELLEDHVFLDGTASMSRQDLSLFGASSSGSLYSNNSNQTEVRTYSLSPSARFRLGSVGVAQMRYRFSQMDSDSNAFNSSQSNDWNASLSNGSAFGALGWFLSTQGSSNDGGRGTTSSSSNYRAGLTYILVPDWRFQVFTGRETNDFNNGRHEATTNWGGGVDWNVSPHTSISASATKRFFGWGYSANLQHRFPRSSVLLDFSKDVSSMASEGGTGLFAFSSQYAAALQAEMALIRAANPGLSETQITNLAMFVLFSRGISPQFSQINAIYSSYSVSRQVRATWVLNGLRNTLSLNASRARRDRIESGTYVGLGDFANFNRITDSTLSALWAHRLSPMTSLSVLLSRTRAVGNEVSGAETNRRQTSLAVGLSTRLGVRTSGSIFYRYSRSSGSAEFSENAISASLVHTF